MQQISGTFMAVPEDTGTLYSKNRVFMCTPEHAVELAHMLSNMEHIYTMSRDQFGAMEAMSEMLRDYFAGDMDVEEIMTHLAGPDFQDDLYTTEQLLARMRPAKQS